MIGVDIERIDKIRELKIEKLDRIFSNEEKEYAFRFSDFAKHFAGMYCAKEALVKALDDKTLCYNKISVIHSDSGKPSFENNEYLNNILSKYGVKKIDVSISHIDEIAIAIVEIN